MNEMIRQQALKFGGGQHKIVCPECSPTRKKKNQRDMSLKIDDKIYYQCWHCGIQGAIEFEERIVKLKPIKTERLDEETTGWLASRGISEKTAADLKLKSCRTFIPKLNTSTTCVAFPYIENNTPYAWKIRSIKEKGFICNGTPNTFFNLQNVKPQDDLIICEGEIDCLTFVETGFESVVSVPHGAVMKVSDGRIDARDDNKFKFLWNNRKKIENATRIIIATDSDNSGQAMMEEIARRIGKEKCWIIKYPDGCKDANDVLNKFGSDAVVNLIADAKPYPISGLYSADKYWSELDEIYDKGLGSGETTGYKNLDDYYTIVKGQLTVVTGHPSSGKSEFIDQLMINLAENKGWKFAVCSFENDPKLHLAKLISKYIKKPFFNSINRLSKAELSTGKNFINEHFSFVHQSDGSLSTIESIIERLKVAVLRYGVRGAIIDPYNYIQKNREISETDWVSDMLTQLRSFAMAYDIHLWFVAHPTKMIRDAQGNIPAPKGYDISGSASWFSKADIGLTVHRPDYQSAKVEVIVWKCRFAWVGKQGEIDLYYDPNKTTYSDAPIDPFSSVPF